MHFWSRAHFVIANKMLLNDFSSLVFLRRRQSGDSAIKRRGSLLIHTSVGRPRSICLAPVACSLPSLPSSSVTLPIHLSHSLSLLVSWGIELTTTQACLPYSWCIEFFPVWTSWGWCIYCLWRVFCWTKLHHCKTEANIIFPSCKFFTVCDERVFLICFKQVKKSHYWSCPDVSALPCSVAIFLSSLVTLFFFFNC